MHDGRLVIRVTAPPAEGKANEAVRRLIAKRLGVPSSRVRIVRGSRGRDKTLSIEDMDPGALARELASVGLGAKRQDR